VQSFGTIKNFLDMCRIIFRGNRERRFKLNLCNCTLLAITQNQDIPRSEGGERVVEEVSVLTDGDLNSQYDKRAFPSYSRIDFADIVWELDMYENAI
jgi:hypothetical protein